MKNEHTTSNSPSSARQDTLKNFQGVCSFGSFPSASSLRRPFASAVAWVAPYRDRHLIRTLSVLLWTFLLHL
mgnify:CR=1 FL=1